MVSTALCYSGDPDGRFGGFDGSGVHLTADGRTTLCGLTVVDVPTVPRTIEPLSCARCHEVDENISPRSAAAEADYIAAETRRLRSRRVGA